MGTGARGIARRPADRTRHDALHRRGPVLPRRPTRTRRGRARSGAAVAGGARALARLGGRGGALGTREWAPRLGGVPPRDRQLLGGVATHGPGAGRGGRPAPAAPT